MSDLNTATPSWDEGLYDDEPTNQTVDEATDEAGAEGAVSEEELEDDDDTPPEIRALNEERDALTEKIQKAHEEIRLERNTAAALAADDSEAWAKENVDGEQAQEEFLGHLAQVKRTELIGRLTATGNEEALVAAYREADSDLGAAILEAVDEDTRRMLISADADPIVTAPTLEPAAEGEELQAPDWGEYFRQNAIAETVDDVGVFATQAIQQIAKGEIVVEQSIRDDLEGLLAEADRYPEGHSFRTKALTAAAGLAQFARETYNASIPFGLGGIEQTTVFSAPDGSVWKREKDGRGAIRETKVEGGAAPSELGLLTDPVKEAQARIEAFDPDCVKTLEDARALPADLWMQLPDDKREQLLRQESAEIEREAAQARRAGQL